MAKNLLYFLMLLFIANSTYATLVVNTTEYHFDTWPQQGLFDLDDNGIMDIQIFTHYIYTTSTVNIKSYGQALQSNQFAPMDYGQLVNDQTTYLSAGEHPLGNPIGRSNCIGDPSPDCSWPAYPNISKAYAGIKFYINGNIHYGWIEFLIRSGEPNTPLENWEGISKIVYDDEPNKAVTVGIMTDASVSGINTLFKVYPNPVKDLLYISGDFPIIDIDVYNINGEKIYSIENANATTSTIPMNTWSKGLYFIVIKSEERIERKRIEKD
ncbi:MAG: T9SS type A sorting domain-containing protein [Cytophagaceae bacterium]|nr:T9SS type A sorting domain-containing protein [Cytophagaceae bacterium]